MSLLVVQNDCEYVQIRRRGRFSMERAQASDPRHRALALKLAKEKMARDLGKRGFAIVNDGRDELQGPLPHLSFSEDDRPDMAHLAAPDWLDLPAQQQWEREEKGRQAKDMPALGDLVDFRLIITFRKATGVSYRSLVASAGGARR